ncbi:hypothetical protein PspLS_10517 [Pyricularia sp. CBS 133598]|nr:hypothetical protein PspLS_10517 [Pyricularia sp. CBS 133598]
MSPSAQPSSWSQVPRTWTMPKTGATSPGTAYSGNPSSLPMALWYNEPLRDGPYNNIKSVHSTGSVTEPPATAQSQDLLGQASRTSSSCMAEDGSLPKSPESYMRAGAN